MERSVATLYNLLNHAKKIVGVNLDVFKRIYLKSMLSCETIHGSSYDNKV